MAMTRSLRFAGESDDEFRSRAERAAKYAKLLIDAALTNHEIRALIADARHPEWTEAGERENPTVRLDYDQAVCIAGIGEGLAATKNKNWGDGPYIQPLEPEDPVDPMFVTYVFKPNSLYNRRFEQRQKLKRLLGKTHRPLVTAAKRSTKRSFVDALTSQQAYVIRKALGLDPTTFWRLCHGRQFADLPDLCSKVDSAVLESLPNKPRQLGLPFNARQFDVSDRHIE
jgi:hypothetical protein